MGLLDLLTSTRRPSEECSVLPADAVAYRLLYANRPSAPFRVSRADPVTDGADLVAEWKLGDPCWQGRFRAAGMTKAVRILLKMHADCCEVHALEQEYGVTWDGDTPTLTPASSFLPSTAVFHFKAQPKFTETVCPGSLHHWQFATSELREPLHEATTECGWTYRLVNKPGKL